MKEKPKTKTLPIVKKCSACTKDHKNAQLSINNPDEGDFFVCPETNKKVSVYYTYQKRS